MDILGMIVGGIVLLPLIAVAYVIVKHKRRNEAEAEQVRELLNSTIEACREHAALCAAKDRYFRAAVEQDTRNGLPPEGIEINRHSAREAEQEGRSHSLAVVTLEAVIVQPTKLEMIALMERYVGEFGRSMNDNAQLINQATDETLKEQIETEGLADAFVVTALKNILAKIKTTSAPQTSGQESDSGRHHVSHRLSTSTAWTRTAFAAIVKLLSLAAPVAAGPLEDASAANDRGGDFATALRLYRPLADQGDPFAQFELGQMYYAGQGVPQDYAEAQKWHRLAADQGNAYAQTILGIIYHFGQGVPQDYAEAQKWFRLAADQGDANAQGSLGGMYRRSEDYVRAHMWYDLAAAHGYPDAVAHRDEVAKLMTPAQIAEAQKLAREWQPKRP